MRPSPFIRKAALPIRPVPVNGKGCGVALRCGAGQPEYLASLAAKENVIEVFDPLFRHVGDLFFHVVHGHEEFRFARFEIHEEQSVVLGKLHGFSGVLAISSISIGHASNAKPREIDTDGFFSIRRDGADRVRNRLDLSLCVNVHNDGNVFSVHHIVVDNP